MEKLLRKVMDQMQEQQKIMLAILEKVTNHNSPGEATEEQIYSNAICHLPSFIP